MSCTLEMGTFSESLVVAVLLPWRLLASVHYRRLLVLLVAVVALFTVVYLPFVYATTPPSLENLANIARRLFPVQRGLTHAYWAPNVWALYNALDYILVKVYLS